MTRTPDNSDLCRWARDHGVGDRAYPVIESTVIHDAGLAAWVVDWLVAHRAMPSFRGRYAAAPVLQPALWHAPGDNALLYDPEQGLEGETATTEAIQLLGTHVELDLVIWPRFLSLGGGSATASPYAGGETQ
jgi:hypothetical protein